MKSGAVSSRALMTVAAALLFSQLLIAGQRGQAPAGAPGGGAAAAGQRGAAPAGPPAGPMPRTADGKPDMSGYWEGSFFVGLQNVENRNVLVDPPDNKIPYQAWAAAEARDIAANRMFEEPELHCFVSGVPHVMYVQFGFQIMQTPGFVTMLWDFMNAYRIVPTDGRPHIPQAIKLFQGDSVGRWEGDTLVINTTNQNNRTWFDTAGNFHSDAIHVVERFTPVDANTISYEAVIEDPQVFTRPWKVVETFRRNTRPGYEQMEFACIEGNRDLQHYTETSGGGAKEVPPEQRPTPPAAAPQ